MWRHARRSIHQMTRTLRMKHSEARLGPHIGMQNMFAAKDVGKLMQHSRTNQTPDGVIPFNKLAEKVPRVIDMIT
jgi:hypothetical protein